MLPLFCGSGSHICSVWVVFSYIFSLYQTIWAIKPDESNIINCSFSKNVIFRLLFHISGFTGLSEVFWGHCILTVAQKWMMKGNIAASQSWRFAPQAAAKQLKRHTDRRWERCEGHGCQRPVKPNQQHPQAPIRTSRLWFAIYRATNALLMMHFTCAKRKKQRSCSLHISMKW